MPLIMRYELLFDIVRDDTLEYFSLGGYTFKINGMEIPFDFPTYGYHVTDYDECSNKKCIKFESGKGVMFNDFKLDNYYDDEYIDLQLDKNAITAKFLSKVDEILEMHIGYVYIHNSKLKNIEYKNITFEDLTTGEVYEVSSNVIKQFNKKINRYSKGG